MIRNKKRAFLLCYIVYGNVYFANLPFKYIHTTVSLKQLTVIHVHE